MDTGWNALVARDYSYCPGLTHKIGILRLTRTAENIITNLAVYHKNSISL